jgi:hypothetical protein
MPPTTCADDAACQAQDPMTICVPAQCACNGELTCVPGCTDDSACAVGQACEALRCAAKPCAGAADCPQNFDCIPAQDQQRCARRPCTSDSDCDGTCVLGACHDTPGQCTPPVA